MSSIAEWLRSVGLEQHTALFLENQVDLETLRLLTEADLKELGLAFGPRKRLLNALSATAPDGAPTAPAEERRQVTVVFCDMVGFTALASRLDPEVLREVLRAYEETCAVWITRYDGYVYQRLGDGVVALFGYPLAHEGEAERAIHAGLGIVEALAGRRFPEAGTLEVRIGIATGIVVVSSEGRGVAGRTVNFASRLQAIASPGSVVVSERVRRLAGGTFEYEDLGELTLKGFDQAARAFRVLGSGGSASRFDAATQVGLTPLVGREEELDLLMDRWRSAQAGAGRVVVVSGGPGIGKSRIVSEFRRRQGSSANGGLHFQGSPYDVSSALAPIVDCFERELGFRPGEAAASKLDKLEAWAVDRSGRPMEDARYLATMLSIPCEERYGKAATTPQRHERETLRSLVDLIEAVARAEPAVMLFEDVHWADPTTLEMLALLVERAARMPLLVLLTTRPEFSPPWRHAHVTELPLERLPRAECRALVERTAGGKPLPEQLLEQIVEKTDGVPLFVEELTKSILESGNLREEDSRFVYAGAPVDLAIPATLRDSLMARLDQVSSVKEVAQIGAAIGREFSHELIEAVAASDGMAVGEHLARLTESGLAYRRGAVPNAVYAFKHALVQDVAYESMLKTRRRSLHGTIARVLEAQFPARRDAEPELVARHYTAAELPEAAIPLWRRAGELALARYASGEASAHLGRGLALIDQLPSGRDRDLLELELRTVAAPAVVAVNGWAAPEVSALLEPAWTVAESLEREGSYLPVLHGLWVHFMSVGRHSTAMKWARRLLEIGERTGNGDLSICGHRAVMTSHFWMGDFERSREHGDRIRAQYDLERHAHIATLTNNDPLSADGSYRAQYLWMLGYPEQAMEVSDAKDEHARRRNHPFDLCFALTVGAQVYDYARDPDRLLARVEEAEHVGRESHVPLMSEIMAQIVKGAAWLRAGRAVDAAALLDESLTRLRGTGHGAWVPYVRANLGEARARTGDLEGGLACIEASLEQIERQGERAHLAEILRLKGWILMQRGRLADAEAALRSALACARAQRARSWELRSATTLARLLAGRAGSEPARAELASVYAWFSEGLDTPDLREAKALLEELR